MQKKNHFYHPQDVLLHPLFDLLYPENSRQPCKSLLVYLFQKYISFFTRTRECRQIREKGENGKKETKDSIFAKPSPRPRDTIS